MHIDLTGHHIDLTEALHAYVSDKMARLERHFDHLARVHVVLTVDKQRHIAEANLHIGSGSGNIHANAVKDDMYAAISTLVDKLDRQILDYKEKTTDHHKKEKAALNLQQQ